MLPSAYLCRKHSMAAAAPMARSMTTGAPSAHTGQRASQHLLHPPRPPRAPRSLCLQSLDATAGVKPGAPGALLQAWGVLAPGGRGGRGPTPVESPLCSCSGLQPELQSSSRPEQVGWLCPESWARVGRGQAAPWQWPHPG